MKIAALVHTAAEKGVALSYRVGGMLQYYGENKIFPPEIDGCDSA